MTTPATAVDRTPHISSRQLRQPWTLGRGLLVVTLQTVLVAATTWTSYAVNGEPLTAAIVAVLLAGTGAVFTARAWRRHDTGLLDLAFEGAILGVLLAAAVTGHISALLAAGAVFVAFLATVADLGDVTAFWSRHTRTRAEIVHRALARTVLDDADRAKQMLTDPRLVDTSPAAFVAAYAQDRRRHAATLAGDAPDIDDLRLQPPGPACSTCGNPTSSRPCEDHQPFLATHQAHTRRDEAR